MEFKHIAFVGSRVNALGLKLAGVEDTRIMEGREAVDEIIRLINEKAYDLIITEEYLMQYTKNSEMNMINTSVAPLILLIPSPEKAGEESLEDLSKRILGIDITKFG
ncbi:MAG: hypothetical protein OH316_01505 [Candidatus Parvarchaeota archaeon]|nr:hypothetical protein [Candidatus Parvarchaeota archaeon]MCW1301792.1 hypothetical protein [Candidatus Parvarchaeota archaeon]